MNHVWKVLCVTILLWWLVSGIVHADAERPPQLLGASIGLGQNVATTNDAPDGTGFYGAAEYVVIMSRLFSPRAYSGLLLTHPNPEGCRTQNGPCDVSAKMGFLGAKARFSVPIPYVAPFVELGLGTSFGAITTVTPSTTRETRGITYHIPAAFGLSLGPAHNFDVAFLFLIHPREKQVNGGATIGLAFKIN